MSVKDYFNAPVTQLGLEEWYSRMIMPYNMLHDEMCRLRREMRWLAAGVVAFAIASVVHLLRV